MFTTPNRTGFGAANTANQSFGFGSNTPSPFGQTQMFGAATSTSFGNPTPGFGQTTAPIFGTPQQSAPLFGAPASTVPAFGNNTQNVFGSNALFGQQNQPQPSTNLFGSTNAAFGQQNKTTGFNFPTAQSTSVFGQNTTQQPQQQNLFQPSTSSNIFGSSGFGTQQAQAQTGTCLKFSPVTGTDTMQKGGNSSMINTKHYSITCMKEYDGKSFEELRFEDYIANRKGPQQSTGFGASAPTFGAVTSSAPSIFGQPENKTVFGAQNNFAQTPFGMSSQPNTTQNVFGKSSTTFGAPVTSANTFGFANTPPSTNIFGSTQPAKPFGTQPAQPLFSQPSTGFGTNTLFGQPATTQTQQNTGFFKPAQPTFSTAQAGAFSFGQTPPATQSSTLFQTSKPNFSLFAQNTPATNTFGQQPAGFGNFNTLAKPAQPTFGQPTQTPSFGYGSTLQANNLFGSKPAFGTNTSSGLFTGTTMQQPNNAFSLQPSNQAMGLASQHQPVELRSMFDMTDPYGFSPHLDGLRAIKKSETHYSTNPKDIETVLHIDKQASESQQRKLRICPPVRAKNKWYLFESNFEKADYDSLEITVKQSGKRLNLKGGPFKKPEPVVVYENGKIVGENNNKTLDYSLPSVIRGDEMHDIVEKEIVNTRIAKAGIDSAEETDNSREITDVEITGEENEWGSLIIEKETNSTTEGIDTCGIICTRPEYYIVPSIEEIAKYKNEDGTCVVKGFTIGRVGYGNVYFPDEMDVSNLNIDELVHFRYREICIYVDDETKPPVGEGLNRKAQVTLDRVFPKKEKNKKEFETDPQVLMTNHFADSLKTVCLKLNTTFLDYRPETGSWVFNVPHFSKYGFVDSDDECDEKPAEDNKNIPANKLNSPRKSPEEGEKELSKHVVGVQATKQETKTGLGGKPFKSRMELSKYDFAEQDSDESFETSPYAFSNMPYNYTITSVTDPVVDMNIQNVQSGLAEENFFNVSKTSKNLRDYKQLFYEADVFDSSSDEPKISEENKDNLKVKSSITLVMPRMKRYKLQNSSLRVSLSKSLVSSRSYMDIALFKGRSFRVGWGRGFSMTSLVDETLISNQIRGQKNLNHTSILILDGLRLLKSTTENDSESDPFMNHLSDFMEVVRKASIFSKQEDETGLKCVPHCVELRGITMLQEITKLANELSGKYAKNVKMRYYANIWNLCMALWDDMENENYVARRQLFSDWLENITAPFVAEDLLKYQSDSSNESNINKALIHISGHEIKTAVKLCFKNHSPQLAMLLSQLSTITNTRQFMDFQLNSWETFWVNKHIDSEILKLYMIVSGTPFDNNVKVCENFDWLRCLGMYFWYFVPSWKSVGYALDCYEDAMAKDYVEKPYPIYCKQSRGTWDILFHMMKLFKNEKPDLDDLLSPLTHTDNQCDFRLSWLLYKAFLALPIGLISEKTKIELTTVFSAQLEQLGLFKWAIFVLLYLDDLKMKKTLVCALLDRNISEESNVIEKELVYDIQIPKEWIHMVKAYQTHQLEHYWEAYKHLGCSQMWYECTDVVLRRLAPQLVVNDNFPLLKKILLPIPDKDNLHLRNKVSILIQFIKLWEKLYEDDDEGIVNEAFAMDTYKELCNLILALKHYPIAHFDQCIIVSEISKYCFKFLISLYERIEITSDTNMYNFENIIDNLILPFDYRYIQAYKIVASAKCKIQF